MKMAANKKGTRRNLPGKPNSPKPPILQTLSVQQEIRLSQLPDPEVLEKYQQIFPDAADIILSILKTNRNIGNNKNSWH